MPWTSGRMPAPAVDVLVNWSLAGCGFAVTLGLLFGPHVFVTAPSVVYVARLGVPWAVWAALFAVYGSLLLHKATRLVGYMLGFFLWGFFAVSAVIAAYQDTLLNLFAGVALFATAVFHVARARWIAVSDAWRG